MTTNIFTEKRRNNKNLGNRTPRDNKRFLLWKIYVFPSIDLVSWTIKYVVLIILGYTGSRGFHNMDGILSVKEDRFWRDTRTNESPFSFSLSTIMGRKWVPQRCSVYQTAQTII